MVCCSLYRYCRDCGTRGSVYMHCAVPVHHEPVRREPACYRVSSENLLWGLQTRAVPSVAGFPGNFRGPLSLRLDSFAPKAKSGQHEIYRIKIVLPSLDQLDPPPPSPGPPHKNMRAIPPNVPV